MKNIISIIYHTETTKEQYSKPEDIFQLNKLRCSMLILRVHYCYNFNTNFLKLFLCSIDEIFAVEKHSTKQSELFYHAIVCAYNITLTNTLRLILESQFYLIWFRFLYYVSFD